VDFVGVKTTVKVVGVMKGRYSQPELTVFHLQFPDGTRINQGPFLGELKSQPISHPQPDGTRRSGPPEYMVFLKKRDDGRYEPTSGPLDSAYAFRELRIPAVGR
jgi:hypothetical protein